MPQRDNRIDTGGPQRGIDTGGQADQYGKAHSSQTKPPGKAEVVHVRDSLPSCEVIGELIDEDAHHPSQHKPEDATEETDDS